MCNGEGGGSGGVSSLAHICIRTRVCGCDWDFCVVRSVRCCEWVQGREGREGGVVVLRGRLGRGVVTVRC
jgi:hypothetical protein